MAYLCKLLLMGNVGKEPIIRTFDNGGKIASFSLATTKRFTDRSGAVQQQTMWHSIQVNGKLADVVEQYVKKGDPLYVEGELTERTYTSQSGEERRLYEVHALAIQMLGQRSGEQQAAAPAAPAQQMLRTAASMQQQRPAPAPAPAQGDMFEPSEDLPF